VPEVPSGERERVVDCDDEVVPEPRVEGAKLGLCPFDQEPRLIRAPAVLEIKADDDAPIRQALAI
jgi:hypothetical protein